MPVHHDDQIDVEAHPAAEQATLDDDEGPAADRDRHSIRYPLAEGFEARQLRAGGALCDVAPTVLKLMGIAQPPEMDGVSLF